MARSVYSTLFLSSHAPNPAANFQVPADKVAVLKDFFVVWGGTAGFTYAQIHDWSTGSLPAWVASSTPNTTSHWEGMAVLNPGTTMSLEGGGPMIVYATASGYLLSQV